MNKITNDTKVITGLVRFSYVNIWKPKAINNASEAKYSISLIISKEDKETLNKIKDAIKNAISYGKTKWGGDVPKNLKLPLRDGDEERNDEAYKNSYFINANNKRKPGIVDKDKKEITDEEKVYSGCYGRASITFYPFNSNGNKGIACSLNNLQKIKDGELLGGVQQRAEIEFNDDFYNNENDEDTFEDLI